MLDEIDRKILRELQEDARTSYAELGRRVGLTTPAVIERVHKLEDAQIITGYRAEIDTSKVGLPITAFIRMSITGVDYGHIVEAAASNLFWLADGAVCTSPLESGALAGVTRALVLEYCQARGIPTKESWMQSGELFRADGAFLTNSVTGIVAAIELDGRPLRSSPFVGELQAGYEELAKAEGGR